MPEKQLATCRRVCIVGNGFHAVPGCCDTSGLAQGGEGSILLQLYLNQGIPAFLYLGLLEGWRWGEAGESSVAPRLFEEMVKFLM